MQTETAYDFHGPELDTATISSATTARKFTYKCESIVSSSSTISDTIRKAVTDRVLNQITSKIISGIKATLPVGKVQLSSELVADEVQEVTRTSEETLSQVARTFDGLGDKMGDPEIQLKPYLLQSLSL